MARKASESGHSTDAPGQNDSAKRTKRAPYVGRACGQCQTRKIRCEGGRPCSQCVARARECLPPVRERAGSSTNSGTLAAGINPSDRGPNPSISSSLADTCGVSTRDLMDRLIGVERQIQAVISSGTRVSLDVDEGATPAGSTEAALAQHGSPEVNLRGGDSDRQTFVGEISVHDELVAQGAESSPVSIGRPFTPKVRHLDRHMSRSDAQKSSRSWIREILFAYDIVPEHLECKTLLHVFFDEIHILYPFLHPPSVWQTFEFLWKRSLLVSCDDLEENGESRLSVALVFICLALGRCTASSRMDNANGAHSGGWSLYSVAMDLMGPLLDITSDSLISLHGLQVLAIMVVYLFRLDASEKADRSLAHAVSSAHILGLHRKEFYIGTSVFNDEMFTRIWWGIYLLDRRLSLESGRPYLIQDANIETRPPLNVSDGWLAQRKSATATISDLKAEIEAETSLAQHTVVPYLEAYISQSRIATDVWKAVYNSAPSTGNMPGMVYDYLDIALDNWWQALPPYLQYQEDISYSAQFSNSEWWQTKQCLNLHMRFAFLKLLVRRPSNPSDSYNHIAAEAYAAQRAASIIHAFNSIPKSLPRYAFTFMHPITSATMILYSVVARNPALRTIHGNTLLSAVQSLIAYCQRTWVSSKMIRIVSKLNAMVHGMLSKASNKSVEEEHSRAESQEPGQRNENSDRGLIQQRLPLPPLAGDPTRLYESTVPLTRQDTIDGSTLWSSGSLDTTFENLPSWATTEFDFEQAFSTYSNGRMTGVTGAETSIFDDQWGQQIGG